ncbi:MAG: insulinase family protein [Lonepinella koalarum]|nr:insulinase family protein [Lonepinella koalarum]
MCYSINVSAEISAPIQGQLDNGLSYTLLPLHEEKGHIEIRAKVHAGSIDETEQQAGVAHMVEHLVFRQSQNYPDIMSALHQQGWIRGRHYNAVTTYEHTTYMLTPPSKGNLEESLKFLSEMLFSAKLTQDDLDKERQIILEEWRQGLGVGNSMNRQRTSAIRTNSRYSRHPVIGTEQSIKQMPARELQDFYHKWYAPNNMQLLIIGDIDVVQTTTLLNNYFGSIAQKKLPKRDYYEPHLENKTRLAKIQDPRSGVSQIAYVFRFYEHKSKAQTEQGRMERMIDRIALSALTERIRNEQSALPEGINSLVVRKSEIGRQTSALGIFAGVAQTSHLLGLEQILTEIRRIDDYPITQAEFDEQKSNIQKQLDKAKKHNNDRNFYQWTQSMMDTVLSDKPYLPQAELAILTENALNKIEVKHINQRIQDWLNARDRIILYQPPRNTVLDLSLEEVEQLNKNVQQRQIHQPTPKKEIKSLSFVPIDTQSAVETTAVFDAQQVQYWRLDNGDKLIWLKSPIAKEKTYFIANSSSGFNAIGLNPWQSQLAAQLITQNPPTKTDMEQLTHWKSQNSVNLSVKQNATKLSFEGNANNENLSDLMRLFYAYQQEIQITQGIEESKKQIIQTINLQTDSVDKMRQKALSLLRYSTEQSNYLPNQNELNKLSAQDLNHQWKLMVKAPMTYYVINDMEESELKALVSQYLGIPRNDRFSSHQFLPTEGLGKTEISINLEPKSEVKLWLFTPYHWQGKSAMQISLLRQIATNKLKSALRDEALGVYSLRFESTLNPETERIESELTFSANPAKVDELIELAKNVLRTLPENIKEEDIRLAKNQFIKIEKARLVEPETWLRRLILSEEQLGNPQYLTEMQQLSQEIDFEQMKSIAAKIYNKDNQKIFVITPQK